MVDYKSIDGLALIVFSPKCRDLTLTGGERRVKEISESLLGIAGRWWTGMRLPGLPSPEEDPVVRQRMQDGFRDSNRRVEQMLEIDLSKYGYPVSVLSESKV